MHRIVFALVLLAPLAGRAGVVTVPPSASIQAAIDAAAPGDVIALVAGRYTERIDFRGRAVTVRGVGPDTVLDGALGGSVVRFATGEGPASVLEDLTVTGGLATTGGGVHIAQASPTLRRLVVRDNAAYGAGSGIWLDRSSASVTNTLLIGNHTAAGDPHTIQIVGGAPRIVNNTITDGDSNGILIGGSDALIANNVIARNGSRDADGARGRGICDFSGNRARIRYNLFFRNRIGAILGFGEDWRRIERLQLLLAPPQLVGNLDGSPGFINTRTGHYALRPRSMARDAGDPDPAFNDRDGSRNDIGHTGGPDAR